MQNIIKVCRHHNMYHLMTYVRDFNLPQCAATVQTLKLLNNWI